MRRHGNGFGLDYVAPDDGKRHINPHSRRNWEARKLQEEIARLGLPWHGGEEWTSAQTDILLNTYFQLYKNATVLGAKRKLLLACGRTFDAVETKLRKLAERYDGDPTHAYMPGTRDSRAGRPFVNADYCFFDLATLPGGKGLACGAYEPAWLAKVLARGALEIKDEMDRLAKRPAGMLAVEEQEQKRLELIHDSVQGAYHSMVRDF